MNLEFPDDLYYTREHEWVRVEDGIAIVGITEYAQDSLGDVVYIELPAEGTEVQKEVGFGVIESVKAVSDLYAPVSGEIKEVNDALPDSPEIVNDDPYGEAWMIKVVLSDESELKDLMRVDAYKAYVSDEKE